MDKDFNENKRQKNCARQRRWYHKQQENVLNLNLATNDELSTENASLNAEQFDQNIPESIPSERVSNNFNSEQELYPKSNIKYGEFLVVFLALVDKLHISGQALDHLLKFIKSLLPEPNIVPSSVHMLDKELNIEQNNLQRRQYVCIACNDRINKGQICPKPECENFRSLAVNKTKINPYFLTNNYKLHFKRVIKKNWTQITEYKNSLNQSNLITDVCNAQAFKKNHELQHNSICIILFLDEAEMTKTTKDNNIYNILGLIVNLPMRMRSFHNNIINFMIWGGYINNFNKVFQYFNPPLEQFFNHLVEIDETLTVEITHFRKLICFILLINFTIISLNSKVKVHLLGVIGDNPGRAKGLNIHQHNGFYACFKCLQKGARYQNKTVYTYAPTAEPRTPEIYEAQVKEALKIQASFQGVKDSTPFSTLTTLPDGEIVDPLHAIYEGTFYALHQLWFNSTSWEKDYYLGTFNIRNTINNVLQKVKIPTDYPRLRRDIQQFTFFTASEYKNYMHHISIFLFKEILPEKCFDHYLLYVLFVRILSKPAISNADIVYSSQLIHRFVDEFKDLYGTENMTFNLHCHLHLPMQVLKFGGFDKLNVFPLEGYFKICRALYFGTKGIAEQILKNTAKKHQLYFLENDAHIFVTHSKLQYVYQKLTNSTYQNVTAMKNLTLKRLDEFEEIEQQVITEKMLEHDFELKTSLKCTISGLSNYLNL